MTRELTPEAEAEREAAKAIEGLKAEIAAAINVKGSL